MAFTGDLENLPIVDIIQLVHTTRKSGMFSVKADRGESNIVFSGGYIVAANHINDSVRIGTVLVKSGAITVDDLKEAIAVSKNTAGSHEPLLATLIQMGKLKPEDAQRGLRKLVEMTIVELMSWTRGTFTFDTDAVIYSSDAQDVMLDAQMVLMDALRLFDERERDRAGGKEVPSFEALYADVLPGVESGRTPQKGSAITADILGLANIEQLEKRIPRPVSEMEIFDPVAIHRQKVRELLPGFSAEDQEAFVSFLKKSAGRKAPADAAARQSGKAIVLFSSDALTTHSILTICKEESVPVFATGDAADLGRIASQCLSALRIPALVFDSPSASRDGLPTKAMVALRDSVRERFPEIPILQLADPRDNAFILESYAAGVRSVLPKPAEEPGAATFVQDMIRFLETFKSYIKEFLYRPDTIVRHVRELKKDIRALREIANPSDAALVMLAAVAEMFERAVTFIVRPTELTGERAVGITSDKTEGPTPADRLKIPLARASIFRDMIEKGQVFFGESSDEALKGLFQVIGKPLSPAVALLPLLSDRKVVAMIYGDFGQKEASPVQLDVLEILAYQVGVALEYALFKRQMAKGAQKAQTS